MLRVKNANNGLRSNRNPFIHHFEGENVWHHVINPAHLGLLFACSQTAVASSALLMTGLKTTRTDVPALIQRRRHLARIGRDLLQGRWTIKMLASVTNHISNFLKSIMQAIESLCII